MDLDALLEHFFGTTDLDALDPARIEAGRQAVTLSFATEREPGRRFALWVILHGLGDAPLPAVAFKDARLREAADAYLDAAERAERDGTA